MKVRVTDIGINGLHLTESLSCASINTRLGETHSDIEFIKTISTDVDVYKTNQGAQVKGNIQATYNQPCSRCAQDCQTIIELKLDSIFQEKTSTTEDLTDNIGISYYSNGAIDLGEHIEEILLLKINPYSYCSENCLGLCPSCGANLNTSKCNCSATIQNDNFLKINLQ